MYIYIWRTFGLLPMSSRCKTGWKIVTDYVFSIPEWFRELSVNGASCLEINDNDLNVYLKQFVLLYADDTVVFATSEETFIQS